ncbi:tetratricopeptide repeat protein [candidate division KSB1 bacterium]|nr:tetratricopeptide repeat protein [candidate division KSB1 bacterium]
MSKKAKKHKKGKQSTNQQPKSTSAPLAKKKATLFTVLMLLVPVLFIILLEMILALTNYGGYLKLVKTNVTDDRYYQLNYDVGKKYFPKYRITTAVSYDVFLKQKPENGYRIFVMGGSSAAGYPYMNNGAFSRMLRTRLIEQFPERHIEVVNTAMPAVNTFTVLDFVRELVRYQPDAFLLYTGHNEFYGGLGAGSTEALGRSRSLIKFYLFLQNFKTVQLVRNGIGWIRGSFTGGESRQKGDATLMERMVGEQEIAYRSPVYQRAHRFFEENLREIIHIARKNSAEVMIGDLVANIRDQKPFVSVFTNEDEKDDWRQMVEQGIERQQNGDYPAAVEFYHQAKAVDSSPAALYFLLGQCYEQMLMPDSARANYYRAKDYDALRFRASEDFNRTIHELGAELKVPVVPLVRRFEQASPENLIGDNLMTDHLHPNLEGFFLIAKSFYEEMQQNDMIVATWNPKQMPPDSVLKEQSGVTEMDLVAAQLKIDILKGGWPFKPKGTINKAIYFKPENYLEQTVWQWQQHELNWEEAHVKMAEYYTKTGALEKAAAEYQALSIGTPYNESPYLKLAEIRILQKNYNDAFTVLQKSLEISDSHYANKWIGTILLNRGKAEEAVPYLVKAVQKNPSDQQSVYNLAGAYHLSGKSGLALQTCQKLYQLNPNYPGLRQFMAGLSQMQKLKNRTEK